LIGNASGQDAEGERNCSEAFPIKANDFPGTTQDHVLAVTRPRGLLACSFR
jgi:hypothetical protein